METLLQALRNFDALRDQRNDQTSDGNLDKLSIREIPNCPPSYDDTDILDIVDPVLKSALYAQGIERLYDHQANALREAVGGKDVVLEAPTASGKTLAFLVPMFDILLKDRSAHAMMIQPMKALSNDQRRQINELIDGVNATYSGRPIESWTYDGDTSAEDKALLRSQPPSIILTTPEMIQYTFLGHSRLWEDKFLRHLKFIIIDEVHEYRGYFGTNFSLLLKRFLSRLEKLGCRPQLFLATATCANPREHAHNLTGRDLTLVKASTSFRPHRKFAFISPQIPNYRFQQIFSVRIARGALACLSMNLSTLVFCPSRKLAENISKRAKKDAERFDLDRESITSYRSGYKPEERRHIEEGMRNGTFKVVFSTNALELGIDIGRLDACILAGFPDNTMSAWQRIGRIGRGWDRTARILYFAMNNAFDRFYADNIDAFLEKPLDQIFIGTNNVELIDRHVPYALHECEWTLEENTKAILGSPFWQRMEELGQGAKPLMNGPGPNYMILDIRGGSGGQYTLKCNKDEIGTVSDIQKFREAYIGAIYCHCGKEYKVVAHGANDILLEIADRDLRTEPSFYTSIQESEILTGALYDKKLASYYGKITVYENYAGYKIVDDTSDTVIDQIEASASRRHSGHAFWICPDESSFLNIDSNSDVAIRTIEQYFRIGSVFVVPSDRHDLSTYCNPQNQSVYVYENVSGGIGIAEKIFSSWRDVLRMGVEIAQNCSCKDGCPRCIHPPGLKDSKTLSKSAGYLLSQQLLATGETLPVEIFDPKIHGWKASESNE